MPKHHFGTTLRADLITASRIDLAIIMLRANTWLKASCTLAVSGQRVPAAVAARVLALLGAAAGRDGTVQSTFVQITRQFHAVKSCVIAKREI